MKGAAISYSAEEMEWLEENRSLVISDYHRAFAEAFGRADVSAANLHGLRKRKGWKVGRAPGRTKGRSWKYSKAELAWLSENRALPITEYHRGFREAFGREDVTAQKLVSLRKRMGWRTGRTGHFEKGGISPNKGEKCADGVGGRHPNARRTQFKKGERPHNAVPLGHERIRDDGYIEISVAETNPYTGSPTRYVMKHVILWKKANGPVPKGMCLKCLDGDRTNTDPLNWKAVPRGVLARLNGGKATRVMAYDSAPGELRPTLLAIAEVEHAAHKLKQGGR